MAVVTRNVAVLKVGYPWKIGASESGREPCSQTPTYDTPATAGKQTTAGMLATARIPAATGPRARDTSKRRHHNNLNSKNASNSRICVEML
jgi:hypothetical protein